MRRRRAISTQTFDRARTLRRVWWMVSMVLWTGCFSESPSGDGSDASGPGTAGSEASTQDGVDASADASTTSTSLATSDEVTSTGSTTEGDTADSTSTSSSADSSGDPPFEPCPELIEAFDVCPGAPWEVSDADLVACDGDAMLTVTSVVDGNVTVMLPVGLADATAVVELGDAPPLGVLKVLRVRTPDAEVIAYRSNGTTSALEAYVDAGDSQGLIASTPYDAAAHRWVRLREDGGWLHFETSLDGVTFAPFYDAKTPFDLADATVGIAAGNADLLDDDTPVAFGQFEFYCTARPAQPHSVAVCGRPG